MRDRTHPAPWKWVPIQRKPTMDEDPLRVDEHDLARHALVDARGYKIAEADDWRLADNGMEWMEFPFAPARELIAAAPEMEALLRKHEWSALAEHGQLDCCPECGAFGPDELADDLASTYPDQTFGVHEPDCALGNLLARLDKAKEQG